MTTLSLRAPIVPRAKFGGFGRLVKGALAALDVFVDAQAMAAEAHRRLQFGRR